MNLDPHGANARGAALMSVGTMLSRATGLIRVSFTLAALGLTATSDAYNAANTTPNMVYELLLGGILTSVFVPVFVERMRSRGEWQETASRFLTLALVILAGLTLLGLIAAPWIMRLYLSGVTDPVRREAQIALGTTLLRWFMPQVVFYGLGAVAGGILTAHRRFAPPMFAPILNNVAVILTMGVFIAWGADGLGSATLGAGRVTLLGLGTTLGVVAMTVALWPALRGIGFSWRWRLELRDEAVRSLFRLGAWVAVYVAANQIAYFWIINLNNRIGEGAYTAYSQAFVFFSLPHAIVAVSIFTVLLPGMAERWTDGDREGVAALCARGMQNTQAFMLPAAAGLFALAGPIVALLAGYGAVGDADQRLLIGALQGFALGLPFFSAFQLLTRTAYATLDSRTPAFVNIVVAIVNLTAAWLLAFTVDLGVRGMALGHAASYVAGTGVLYAILHGRLGGLHGKQLASTILRAGASAALCGVAAWGAGVALGSVLSLDRPPFRLVQVLGAVLAGVLAFTAAAFMFGVREVDDVRTALKTRWR
ncbi:MAG: murein biosynthesis integral membrane protein MurJ [Actinomycetota bacterium]